MDCLVPLIYGPLIVFFKEIVVLSYFEDIFSLMPNMFYVQLCHVARFEVPRIRTRYGGMCFGRVSCIFNPLLNDIF